MSDNGHSNGDDSANASTHVHFDEAEDTVQEHNSIRVQDVGNGKVNVHLGFMQVNHKYSVHFPMSKSLLPASSEVVQKEMEPPNLNCSLHSITDGESNDMASVQLEFSAVKAKLQKETIVLQAKEDGSKCVTLVVQTRVLGKGKGTPLLHDGIKIIGYLEDPEESDMASDWKGFDEA